MEDGKKKESKANEQTKKNNITNYGEFICSYDHWLPIDKQKEQVKEMENMTKNKKE